MEFNGRFMRIKMKAIFNLIAILLCLEMIHGNNEKINEGASTSTQQDNDPTQNRCAWCEIQYAAFKLVFLMLAEDRSHGDLIHLMNNEFHELEAFHEAVSQYILEAGGPLDLSFEERSQRIRYFYSMVERFVLQILEKACTQHYTFRFYYEYNREERLIRIFEKIDFLTAGKCLCVTGRYERKVLTSVHELPLPKKPEKAIVPIENEVDTSPNEITAYYIVPLPLIVRFYRLWLMDANIGVQQENFFNGCTATLLGRLRRSMQKILLYGLKESGLWASNGNNALGHDDFSFSDETVLIENLERSRTWMAGNMFIGPAQRGIANPTFGRRGEDLFQAFEYYVEPIIGTHRYVALLNLYNQLMYYVRHAQRMPLFERLNMGFIIFSSMTFLFYQYPMTTFNIDQWQEYESLDSSENYWVIRPRRDPRSVDYYKYDIMPENANMTLTETKSRWRTFIVHVMSISMEAQSRNESLTWSCDWTCLYNEYLNQTSLVAKPNDECQECTSFDEFLYQKASNNNKWDICNINVEADPSRWCAAWRRIMDDINDVEHKKLRASRWKSLSQTDIGTIISWLVSQKNMAEEEYLPTYKKGPNRNKKYASSFEVGLCFLTTIVPTILSFRWNDCRRAMG